MFLRVILLAASTVLALRAPAAETGVRGIDGVVTVQTTTTAGHDFSQYFLAAWRDFDGSGHYALALRERPSARHGSEVWISHGERTVLHLRLPPARANLASLATGAAEQVLAMTQRAQAERMLGAQDADLAPDEF